MSPRSRVGILSMWLTTLVALRAEAATSPTYLELDEVTVDPARRAGLPSAPGQAVTYAAAPFGSGQRMGLDRDLDDLDASDGDGSGSPTEGDLPDADVVADPDASDPAAADAENARHGCSCRVTGDQGSPGGACVAALAAGVAAVVARGRRRAARS